MCKTRVRAPSTSPLVSAAMTGVMTGHCVRHLGSCTLLLFALEECEGASLGLSSINGGLDQMSPEAPFNSSVLGSKHPRDLWLEFGRTSDHVPG